MVDRFAPVRLKFSGRARSRCSIAGFIAPSAASLSASSFPSSPLWPLTHWKAVWLFLILSQAAVVLKSLWFVTPIQPLSSHSSRRSVSPSITYLESLLISRGTCVGVFFATCRTAYSSPVWLLWSGPGTLRALLPGSLCPYQTPLPAWAFSSPFFMQEPSVYTITVFGFSAWFGLGLLNAGRWLLAPGWVNILIVWLMLSCVTQGSKTMGPPFSCTSLFLCFLLGVRSSPSGTVLWRGFHLGYSVSRIFPAILLHLCGLGQLDSALVSLHFWQGQFFLALWLLSCLSVISSSWPTSFTL